MNFANIAPHLANPIILVGFALFLFFGIHRALLRARIIPPLDVAAGSQVVLILLKYGFYIALLIIVLGFAYAAYQTREKVADRNNAFEALRLRYEAQLTEREKTNGLLQKQLSQTIDALKSVALNSPSDKQADQAIDAFLSKDPTKLEQLLEDRANKLAKNGSDNLKAAADMVTKLGHALFFDNPGKALAAFRQATEWNPDDGDAWMAYAFLNLNLKNYAEAKKAYERLANLKNEDAGVFKLDLRMIAISEAGVANVYAKQGKLQEAEVKLNTAILPLDPKTDTHNLLTAHRVLVDVLIAEGKFDQAQSELKRLESIVDEVNEKDQVTKSESWFKQLTADTRTSRCVLDGKLLKQEAALLSCQASLDLSSAIGHSETNESNSRYFLGLAQMKAGQLDASESSLRNSKAFFERENPNMLPEVDANLGYLLFYRDKKSEGCDLLEQSKRLALAMGDTDLASKVSEILKGCAGLGTAGAVK